MAAAHVTQFPTTTTAKTRNPHRISLSQLAENFGYDDRMEFLESECTDSIVPACCEFECEVEPDGRCEHGCPSALLAAGLI